MHLHDIFRQIYQNIIIIYLLFQIKSFYGILLEKRRITTLKNGSIPKKWTQPKKMEVTPKNGSIPKKWK